MRERGEERRERVEEMIRKREERERGHRRRYNRQPVSISTSIFENPST
jgi:hypothetical protein